MKKFLVRGLYILFVVMTLVISAYGVATAPVTKKQVEVNSASNVAPKMIGQAVSDRIATSAGNARLVSVKTDEGFAPRIYTPSGPIPVGIQTVSALLAHPAYNIDAHIYGRVSGLGEVFCPCFAVASGGKSVDVWFDLMGQEPGVSVPEMKNGDWVIVTGQLKPGVFGLPSRDFWASDIQPNGQ